MGYARVSTQDPSTNLQLDALAKAGCVRIFSGSTFGAQRDRPELSRALDYRRVGHTLAVWKLDRHVSGCGGLAAASVGFVEPVNHTGVALCADTPVLTSSLGRITGMGGW